LEIHDDWELVMVRHDGGLRAAKSGGATADQPRPMATPEQTKFRCMWFNTARERPSAWPRLVRLLATLVLACASPPSVHAYPFEAGFVTLTITDPIEGGPMAAIVVYPTTASAATTSLGPFTIAAGRNLPPVSGTHPLIVISHGTGGSMLGHHDALTALARAGFIAAAVEHPRNNYRDDSGFGTDLQLYGRSHHIKALIDGLLIEPTFGPLIDKVHIGMVGHSAGGYTALLVAGAVPNFDLDKQYRAAVGAERDPYRQRADSVAKQRWSHNLRPIADPRVKAIVLLAPALGYVFDTDGLADVRIPVKIYRPSADEMLPHPWFAERIAQLLPTRPEYSVVDGAGHFTFLAPCLAFRVD
jgi:predicted dienelactone hydrolase